jgi:hypothetical protein
MMQERTALRGLVKRPVVEQAALSPKYDELRAAVRINRDKLDEEVERQSSLFIEICEEHVQACSSRDLARDELARTDAEIAREARRKANEAKEKMTDAMCSDAIMLDPRHVAGSRKLQDLRREADRWDALREAFGQRVRMLHELVQLYGAGYFTSGTAGGTRSEVNNALAQSAREKMDAARKAKRESGNG